MSTAPELLPDTAPSAAVVPDPVESGDWSFDLSLERVVPRLQRYAARRLGDDHEAEEVVQEALLRAHRHRHLLAAEDDLMAWTTVVTSRLVIDRLRTRGRMLPMAEVPPSSRTSRDTAEVVVARDEARLALSALEALPSRQAAVLWAREVEGLSYVAIADRFRMSDSSVRSMLHRARRSLRREYTARGGSLPFGGLVVLAPWLRRLWPLRGARGAVRRCAAPATASATALAIVSLVSIGRDGGHPVTSTPGTPPAASAAAHARVGTAATVTVRRVPASAVPSPTAATAGAAGGSGPRPPLPAPRVGCGTVPGTRAGVNCPYPHQDPELVVGPRLPDNPTGVDQLGVRTDLVDCRQVPATRLAHCSDTAPGARP